MECGNIDFDFRLFGSLSTNEELDASKAQRHAASCPFVRSNLVLRRLWLRPGEPGFCMNRRAFPQFGMSQAPAEALRQRGIVVIRFMDSLVQDPQRLQPHYHEFFQLFLLRGRAAVMHDFVEFVTEGMTLVFLTPGQIHTARPLPDLIGTTISFTQAFFDHDSPPPSKLFDFPFFFPAEARPWLSLSPDDPWRIAESFDDLQREFDEAAPGAADVLRSMLQILLVRANRLHAELYPPREVTRSVQLLRQFHLAVEQNFRTMQSVSDYARLLGVTANHLHDVVHEQMRRPAGEVIRERRLLDAKRLLLHSQLSVSEVGYELGFRDPSYFSRFFRRYEGSSPAEFRESIREKYQRNAA